MYESLDLAVEQQTATHNYQPAISLQGIQHTYRTNNAGLVHAIADASLTQSDGEFVAIVGPSGCGKSTLLKIIAGLMKPTAGDVRVHGRRPSAERVDFGMVFQSPTLLPWRSVRRNVALPLEVQGVDAATRKERVDELLALVGLNEFADRSPHELSGGMQQRASIARALSTDPPLLLMDEPFGALDALTREQMNLDLMSVSRLGKTVVFVTHSISEAVFLADRVLVMSKRPSTVVASIDITLHRPRTLEQQGLELFGRYTNQIRAALGSISGE